MLLAALFRRRRACSRQIRKELEKGSGPLKAVLYDLAP